MRFGVAFIMAVGVLDVFLTVRFSESLDLHERNPIARLLIFETLSEMFTFHHGLRQRFLVVHTDVSWLVGLKVVGLLVSQRIFAVMLAKRGRFVVPVVAGVAAFQFWLLIQFLR